MIATKKFYFLLVFWIVCLTSAVLADMLPIQYNSTSNLIDIALQNYSSSASPYTGAGLTALAYNTTGLACYYKRQGDATWTSVSLASASVGTYASGGFTEEDSTHAKGVYEFDPPNACFSKSGAAFVTFSFYGATNLAQCYITVPIVGYAPTNGNNLGLAYMPTAAPGSSGGFILPGTGTDQLNLSGGRADANMTYIGGSSLSTTTAQLGVNVVKIGGFVPSFSAANNLSVDTVSFNGSSVQLDDNFLPEVSVQDALGVAQTLDANNVLNVSTKYVAGHSWVLDANNYPKIDVQDILANVVTLDSNNVLNVSAKYLAGTALTGRDIGASVLLSSGTGTGQIGLSHGNVITLPGQGRYNHVWFVNPGGNALNDGWSFSDAFGLPDTACSAASSGDAIVVAPGTYTEPSAITIPNGVAFLGAGPGLTIINSTYSPTGTNHAASLRIPSNSEVCGFTFNCNLSDGHYHYGIGNGPTDSIVTNCYVHDVVVNGDTDGIYLTNGSTGNYFRKCIFNTSFDTFAFFLGSGSGNVTNTCEECNFYAVGPDTTSSTTTRGVNFNTATIGYFKNCIMSAQNGGGTTAAVNFTSGGTAYLDACRLQSSTSNGGTAYDVAGTGGACYVYNTTYNPAAVSISSGGTLTIENAPINGANQFNGAIVANVTGNLSGSVGSVTNQVTANMTDWNGSAMNNLIAGRVDSSVGAYQSGQAPLQPATSGRTLLVNSTGGTAIDWANLQNPSSAVNLSGTTINLANTATTVTNQVTANITDILGQAPTLDSNNVLNVSTKYLAGTALTGRDIGASVLLSSGAGTGQILLSSGDVTFGNTSIGSVIGSVGSVVNIPLDGNGNVKSDTEDWLTHAVTADGSNVPYVDTKTNSDKTGYSLTTTPPTAAQNATALLTDLLSGTDFNTPASFGAKFKLFNIDSSGDAYLSYGTGAGQISLSSGIGTTGFFTNAPSSGGGNVNVAQWGGTNVQLSGGLPLTAGTITLPQPPPPGYGGQTITGNAPAGGAIIANQTITATATYTFTQPIQINNYNSSNWTQIILTVKGATNQPDNKSMLMLQKSNPGQSDDGVVYWSGSPVGGKVQKTDGSITIGSTSPNTSFTLNADPTAFTLPPGNYVYNVSEFTSAGNKVLLTSGPLIISASVLNGPGQNP